jgi:hypothetical protein
MTLWMEPVKKTNNEAYLVVYQFIFREISWMWIFRFIIELVLIGLFLFNWDKIISYF